MLIGCIVEILYRFWSICLLMLLLAGCSSSASPLTVKVDIQTSAEQESLVTVQPPNEIILDFSAPLNMSTIDGRVSLHVVKTGRVMTTVDPEIEVISVAQVPNRLIVRTKNGSRLPSGEEYRLGVAKGLKSVEGATLIEDYVRFFATDYVISLSSLGALIDRTVTIVISDIHLGDQRSIDNNYGWFIQNSAALVNFLNYVRQRPDVKELVIAGDLFDEWVSPMNYDAFAGGTQQEFVDKIAAAHKPVIDAFKTMINEGNIRVTYVPGNHDMLVQSGDVQRILPGINEGRDVKGLGKYTPTGTPEMIIEHGHRYDFFNAPDQISNRSITGIDSIFSPGFFVSKIASTSDLERRHVSFYRDKLNEPGTGLESHYLSYWAAWMLIMSQKPVQESWDQKLLLTGADGYTGVYCINDLIPQYEGGSGPLDVVLYKNILDTWTQRQTLNQVPVTILPEVAIAAGALNRVLDAQAVTQYFSNKASDKRIVVFGHTHEAFIFTTLNHEGKWSVYANSGTWIDSSKQSCTFVEMRPRNNNGATPNLITVYQYIGNENILKIKSAAMRD